VAGELIVNDTIVRGWIASWETLLNWVVPTFLATAMTALAWALPRQAKREAIERAGSP
jgi:hypothetical protein